MGENEDEDENLEKKLDDTRLKFDRYVSLAVQKSIAAPLAVQYDEDLVDNDRKMSMRLDYETQRKQYLECVRFNLEREFDIIEFRRHTKELLGDQNLMNVTAAISSSPVTVPLIEPHRNYLIYTPYEGKKRTREDEERASVDEVPAEIAFRKINRYFSTFLIWRIEDTNVVPVAKDQYGIFSEKEAYIIYAATLYGQSAGPQIVNREIRGQAEYHIHFWLGKSVSTEKAGVAAYKTIELDTYLDCRSSEHREVQGNESARFKSYFLQGIKILNDDPNQSVSHIFEPRLYLVKGIRAPIVTQMPKVSWSYFTSADVFLLHTKNTLFVWIGRMANLVEKSHATKLALQIRAEYNNLNTAFVDDGYERQMNDEDKYEFELFLPLNERTVKTANEITDENTVGLRNRTNLKLYQCSEAHSKYRVTEIKTGPLMQEDLNKHDVFILDQASIGVWVWVGKRASNKERTEALRNARGFVKKKKYPNNVPVTRIVDGLEPIEFKLLFDAWKDKEDPALVGNKVAVIKVTKFDALTMHERPVLAAKSQLLDDGSGSVVIWRVKRFDMVEIPKEKHGVFFTGDCYIILYNYQLNSESKYVIYYWRGVHSMSDEQKLANEKTIEIDATITEGRGIQIKVHQGNEPSHFLQLFKGKMKVFCGKGTDFDISGKNLKTPNYYLFCIEGSSTYNTKATQVPLKASSLNSNYCFVLRKGNGYFIWCGTNSTGDNKEMAKGFIGADFVILLEGNESAEFWNTIGGKGDYKKLKICIDHFPTKIHARLFQCSFMSDGTFKAEEMLNFHQTDLEPENIMLLDAYNIIYVWIGNFSAKDQKKLCMQMANEYLLTDPSGRNDKTTIAIIRQGFEPPTFIGFFENWDKNLLEDYRNYEELRAEIEHSSSTTSIPRVFSIPSRDDNVFDNYNKYPVHILQGSADKLPTSVDPLRKELHLTYDDFVGIFKMEYSDFEKLPQWKQKEMKKTVGLF